jgi:CRISPR system Cascade subunit CasD
VIGLLAACLGWGKDRDAEIAELASALALGVRVDRPGRAVVDFHTVSGGVMSAGGEVKKIKSTGEPETVVSERHYLADAAFTLAIGGPRSLLDRLEGALREPVWPPYLGRKSCPPSHPLLPKAASAVDLEAVLGTEPYEPRAGEPVPPRLRCVVDSDGTGSAPGVYATRQDVPLSFAARRFAFRTVREFEVPTPGVGGAPMEAE